MGQNEKQKREIQTKPQRQNERWSNQFQMHLKVSEITKYPNTNSLQSRKQGQNSNNVFSCLNHSNRVPK